MTEALSYKLTAAQVAALNAQGMAATASEPFNIGAFIVACAGAIVLAVLLWQARHLVPRLWECAVLRTWITF